MAESTLIRHRKYLTRSQLTIFVFAAVLFIVSTAIPRPFTPRFQCIPSEIGSASRELYVMHRAEHGFPLPIIKRSVSDFDCRPLDGKGFGGEERSNKVDTILLTNPDRAHEQYAYGYIVISSIFINAAFWLLIAFAVSRAVRMLK